MTKILSYDSPQVQPGLMDGARINPGAAGNPLGDLGQGLQQAAAGFSQIERLAQDQRGQDAVTEVQKKKLEKEAWVSSLKGKQAFDPDAYGAEKGTPGSDLLTTALSWFDADAEESGRGLRGDALKTFQFGVSRLRLGFEEHVRKHEGQEAGVVAKDSYEGVQAVENQNIAQNAVDPSGRIQIGVIADALARKAHVANQLSDYFGEGPDSRKARELAVTSDGHAIVLDALLKRNNSQSAQTYFDLHRGQMDKQVVSVMEGKIQQAVLANDVQAQADRIQSMGLPLDQQDAEARKVFAKNPEGMKSLQSELEHRFSVQKTAQSVALQETTGKLWDMRFPTKPGQQAVSMPQIMRSTEWAALDGEKRNQLRAQWESYTKRNENDPATQVAKHATYMQILDDPAGLMGLSDLQIASMTGTLGADYTMKLMDMKRKAAGNLETLKANTLNDIPYRNIAGEYGLKTRGNLTQEQEAKLGSLRGQALEAIRYEQAATGKVLGPERKEEILRKLLARVVTNPENAIQSFIPGDWNDRLPLFEAVRSKPPVPQAFRDIMSAKMKALGRQPPSPLDLSRLWIEARAKGLVDEQGNQVP